MSDPRDQIIAELRACVERLERLVLAQAAEIAALKAEIAQLRGSPPSGGDGAAPRANPSWVKSNAPKSVRKRRKNRDGGYSRKLTEPDEVVVHSLDQCPDCGLGLPEGWEHDRREVIDIPAVRVRVIHHRIMRYRCRQCNKQFVASPDLGAQVAGHHRVSIRLMSFIGYLRMVCRLPVRTIQNLLKSLYALSLSTGAIVGILHSLAKRGQGTYQQLCDAVRGSPFVHADETGWRENGVNGYLWSFSTPGVRYFVRDQSRGHQVPEQTLGDFGGILVSDFYAAYNYHRGLHQRCWVHLLRELKELQQQYPQKWAITRWTKSVQALYVRAKGFKSLRKRTRVRAREAFQATLVKLAQKAANSKAPHATLAKRMIRFEKELFTFVEYPGVPSENNAAERAIRPAVIQRKISGGTRSDQGSNTMNVLMSLFATWNAQGSECFAACQQLLASKTQTHLS